MSIRSPRRTRPAVPLVVSLLAVVPVVGACGDSGPELTAEAARGRDVAAGAGCWGCHGTDGTGGVGPTWTGLYDSPVELADGSTVVADDEYLERSILDPTADMVAGYTLQMPANTLTEDDARAVIAYIEELS